jgi:hypothetical protein
MQTYPLTLTFDHRSSDHKLTITNAQGQLEPKARFCAISRFPELS